jgi:hypothetical protein
LPQVLDLNSVQRLIPDQRPHSGLDAVQAAQNLDGTGDAGCLPARDRLQFGQHPVEALAQIGQNVIGVGGQAVFRLDRVSLVVDVWRHHTGSYAAYRLSRNS